MRMGCDSGHCSPVYIVWSASGLSQNLSITYWGFLLWGNSALLPELLDGIGGSGVSITAGFFRHQSHPNGQKTLIGGAYSYTVAVQPKCWLKTTNYWTFSQMCTKPVALTIAGFDPGSGAGITADLKTFAAHGIYGVACITALTVQSTLGVRAVEPLSVSLVRQTLDCLAEDVSLSGVKIGMLGSSAVAGEVVSFLTAQSANLARERIVLDPVLRSTSGTPLIDVNGVRIIREKLLHRVGWITPNTQELAILIG